MGIDSTYINERLDEIGTEIANTLGKAALPVLFSTFSIAVELLIYLVASFYFIVHGDRFVMAFRAALNRNTTPSSTACIAEINSTLGRVPARPGAARPDHVHRVIRRTERARGPVRD